MGCRRPFRFKSALNRCITRASNSTPSDVLNCYECNRIVDADGPQTVWLEQSHGYPDMIFCSQECEEIRERKHPDDFGPKCVRDYR